MACNYNLQKMSPALCVRKQMNSTRFTCSMLPQIEAELRHSEFAGSGIFVFQPGNLLHWQSCHEAVDFGTCALV